jgi:hypothetical protein
MAAERIFDEEADDSILTAVKEGMDVYGPDDNKIGAVERVHFGAEADEGAVTPAGQQVRDRSLTDELADVFRADQLPDELRERLLYQGFIRIDATGLFAADRYATPDLIASVSGDRVILRATRDELLKR